MGLTIEKIIEDASDVELDPSDTYHVSYPHLVSFFADAEEITEREFIIAAHIAFGWIGSQLVLTGGQERVGKAALLFAGARHRQRLCEAELEYLKATVCTVAALKGKPRQGKGGSLVAVSKLLHFVNPEVYAIWDSRVCNYMYGCAPQPKHREPSHYLSYLDECYELTRAPGFPLVHRSINAKLGYDVSAPRALELVMYTKGADR